MSEAGADQGSSWFPSSIETTGQRLYWDADVRVWRHARWSGGASVNDNDAWQTIGEIVVEVLARSALSGWRAKPVPSDAERSEVADAGFHGPRGLLPASLGSAPWWRLFKRWIYSFEWQAAGAVRAGAARQVERRRVERSSSLDDDGCSD